MEPGVQKKLEVEALLALVDFVRSDSGLRTDDYEYNSKDLTIDRPKIYFDNFQVGEIGVTVSTNTRGMPSLDVLIFNLNPKQRKATGFNRFKIGLADILIRHTSLLNLDQVPIKLSSWRLAECSAEELYRRSLIVLSAQLKQQLYQNTVGDVNIVNQVTAKWKSFMRGFGSNFT